MYKCCYLQLYTLPITRQNVPNLPAFGEIWLLSGRRLWLSLRRVLLSTALILRRVYAALIL